MGNAKQSWDFSPYVLHAGIEFDGFEISLCLVKDEKNGRSQMGINCYHPRRFPKLNEYSERFTFVESHAIGETYLSAEVIKLKIRRILGNYVHPDTETRKSWMETHPEFKDYHPYHHNCNHFADDVARCLTGKSIPQKANRASAIAKLISFW